MPSLAPKPLQTDYKPSANAHTTKLTRLILATITHTKTVVELKFIHECGSVGHVSGVMVKHGQAPRLRRRLIDSLASLAAANGCYKTILSCNAADMATLTANIDGGAWKRKGAHMEFDHR
jgi:hypothetical protein